jgi:beta-hydroxylase
MTKINHWYKATVIRASQTENVAGDQVGVLNKLFSFAYYLRLPGKALKRRSRLAYYTVKWLLVGGLVVWLIA